MKKWTGILVFLFMMGWISYPAEALTIGYIEVQKVFSTYEKTKKAQEQIQKKEKAFQEEVSKRQKQFEKAKEKGASDEELKKMGGNFEKELDPKRADIMESQQKMAQEIQNDIIKATESVAKEKGVDIVLDRQVFITGGIDLTDKVIEVLNKK